MTIESEKALSIVAPALTPEQAKKALEQFEQVMKAMLNDDDFQVFESKGTKHHFPKKSGFRKLALAFNVSTEVLEERYEEKKEDKTTIGVWHFRVKAIAPNGRYAEGVGSFSTDEREVSHALHDPRAMAHVRATNRAISDLIAGGMLSAEEILDSKEYKAPIGREKPKTRTVPEDDLTLDELTKRAKALGYKSNEEVNAALGTKNLGEWRSQGHTLREAEKRLEEVKAQQEEPEDIKF